MKIAITRVTLCAGSCARGVVPQSQDGVHFLELDSDSPPHGTPSDNAI